MRYLQTVQVEVKLGNSREMHGSKLDHLGLVSDDIKAAGNQRKSW